MPTFKFEDMDDSLPYGGDNDMYFRQWRLPSMKAILDEKLDRDFHAAVAKKEDFARMEAERRQRHSKKYDEKFQDLIKKMSEVHVNSKKESETFPREPTELELKIAREELEKEFASPSSTAKMVPYVAKVRPRPKSLFGDKVVNPKSLVLPSPISTKSALTSSKGTNFSAHETVINPRSNESFNLDNYTGSRPSFDFARIKGATSTPISMSNFSLFPGHSQKKEDDSVFENSKFVTAVESPIMKTEAMMKALEVQKLKEDTDKQQRLEEKKLQDDHQPKLTENAVRKELQTKEEALGARNDKIEKEKEKGEDLATVFQRDLIKTEEDTEEIPRRFTEAGSKASENCFPNSAKSKENSPKPATRSIFGGGLSEISHNSLNFGGITSPPGSTATTLSQFDMKPTEFLPKSTLFSGTTQNTSKKSELNPLFGGIFDHKLTENSLKSSHNTNAGVSSSEATAAKPIFGGMLSQNAEGKSAKSSIFGDSMAQNQIENVEKTTENVQKPKIDNKENQSGSDVKQIENIENPSKAATTKTAKPPTRPYIIFKNYIGLLETLMNDKKTYEISSDSSFRSLLKRTITEKVTVFTHRQTSSQARAEILDFFKSLLLKKQVLGFSVFGEAPSLELKTDEDVNYSVYCIVEKYISLAELDEELSPTISDLISRLSCFVRRVEKVFIVLMLNKSTLLRQNVDECIKKFVEHDTAKNSDELAIEWNQEKALVTLFFTVFAKNAHISTTGRKMVLSDELLWKYVETSISHVLEVPKSSFILLHLITTCKPRLYANKDRWIDVLLTIETDIIPKLEAEPFPGDEAIVSQLKQIRERLQTIA